MDIILNIIQDHRSLDERVTTISREFYIKLNFLKCVSGGTDGVDDEGDYDDNVYVYNEGNDDEDVGLKYLVAIIVVHVMMATMMVMTETMMRMLDSNI